MSYLSSSRAEVRPTFCVSGWKAFPGSTLQSGQALGPESPSLASTFCLSIQEPRQAWRIASGAVCSLLFPAWVVTNMQRWHWESCGSRSPSRDPRVMRPRQGTVKVALQRCSVPVLPGACRETREGGVLQGRGRGDESGQCQGWGSRLTWVVTILTGAPEDKAADQLGQHAVHQTVQQDDSVALGQALADATRHQGYHVAHLGHSLS